MEASVDCVEEEVCRDDDYREDEWLSALIRRGDIGCVECGVVMDVEDASNGYGCDCEGSDG